MTERLRARALCAVTSDGRAGSQIGISFSIHRSCSQSMRAARSGKKSVTASRAPTRYNSFRKRSCRFLMHHDSGMRRNVPARALPRWQVEQTEASDDAHGQNEREETAQPERA